MKKVLLPWVHFSFNIQDDRLSEGIILLRDTMYISAQTSLHVFLEMPK